MIMVYMWFDLSGMLHTAEDSSAVDLPIEGEREVLGLTGSLGRGNFYIWPDAHSESLNNFTN